MYQWYPVNGIAEKTGLVGYNAITACTVVQSVVKAKSQSNGNGQISIPRGAKTPERILMKLEIYNYVVGMTIHAINVTL